MLLGKRHSSNFNIFFRNPSFSFGYCLQGLKLTKSDINDLFGIFNLLPSYVYLHKPNFNLCFFSTAITYTTYNSICIEKGTGWTINWNNKLKIGLYIKILGRFSLLKLSFICFMPNHNFYHIRLLFGGSLLSELVYMLSLWKLCLCQDYHIC